MTRRLGPALVALGLMLASCGPAGTTAPPPSAERPALSFSDVAAEPIERRAESVALAFDAEAAASILHEVPGDLDFARYALVCVYLGPRQTTGWSLDLRTASLTADVLSIRARETAPRAGTRPQVTYPADCGLLPRAALPLGRLTVRADDTVTDEFIAETVIDVPAAASTP